MLQACGMCWVKWARKASCHGGGFHQPQLEICLSRMRPCAYMQVGNRGPCRTFNQWKSFCHFLIKRRSDFLLNQIRSSLIVLIRDVCHLLAEVFVHVCEGGNQGLFFETPLAVSKSVVIRPQLVAKQVWDDSNPCEEPHGKAESHQSCDCKTVHHH